MSNGYYSPAAAVLKASLERAFPDSTWVILWDASYGLVVEGRSLKDLDVYILAHPCAFDSSGRLVWSAALRFWPGGQEKLKGPAARHFDLREAIREVYPGTRWATSIKEGR